MRFQLLSFFLLLTLPCSLFSQVPASFRELGDPSRFKKMAKERADTVHTLQSRFDQVKDMSFMEKKVTSHGRFFFKKPNNVRWEYTDPFEHLILIRGDKLIVKGEKEKDSYDMGSNEMFQKMNELIVSSVRGQVFDNPDFEKRYFQNEGQYLVLLEPKDKSMKEFFEQMRLYFSKREHEVKKVEMLGASGDSTIITFENKRINVPISKSTFRSAP